LFGRNWGCAPGKEFKHLHFELCYYQAIEEAIQRKLPRVEAGAQGEHKLQRGLLPNFTYSAHYLPDPMMQAAVQKFLDRENVQVGDLRRPRFCYCHVGCSTKRRRSLLGPCDYGVEHSVPVIRTLRLLQLDMLTCYMGTFVKEQREHDEWCTLSCPVLLCLLLQLQYTWQALTLEGSPFKEGTTLNYLMDKMSSFNSLSSASLSSASLSSSDDDLAEAAAAAAQQDTQQ